MATSPCRSALVLLFAAAAHGAAAEWPGLRGPNHDGSVARGTRFATGEGALAVGWRARLGSGYSGIAVARGRAVTSRGICGVGRPDVVAEGRVRHVAVFDEA